MNDGFLSMVKISADEPERLRRCDVDRVMYAAVQAFDESKFQAFRAWLSENTSPETSAEVKEWERED